MDKLSATLEPREVWEQFQAISAIPRCSGSETAIIAHLRALAEGAGLVTKVDKAGNLLVEVPASPGLEGSEGVVVQGHVDMVCEKNSASGHDFAKDAIQLCLDGDVLTANGTTLGADNGIAVAFMAALMTGSYVHGPLELLFTVDEETGLTGAANLDGSLLKHRRLINLDSEDEGHICIGCAGGRDTTAVLQYTPEPYIPDSRGRCVEIAVAGLRGGHSGVEIHLELGNALCLLARLLDRLTESISFDLLGLSGGDKHNAIPREAAAIVTVSSATWNDLQKLVGELATEVRQDLGQLDSGFRVTLTEVGQAPSTRFPREVGRQLLSLLRTLPNGVQSLSRATPGLVSSSTNLAAVKYTDYGLKVLTSQRCESEVRLDDLCARIRRISELNGFETETSVGYPGWNPNPASPLLAKAKELFAQEYGREPIVEVIHAGLECGVIGKRVPGMDMISFGPDIRGAHTPGESVSISSTARVWDYFLALLGELA